MRCFFRLCCMAALTLAAMSPLVGGERSLAEAEAIAQRVLERAIIIDTHADTPEMMVDQNYDLADPASPYMISIPKMRQGHLGGEFFAIWVSVDWPKDDIIARALREIDAVREQIERHHDALGLATSTEDIARLHREGKIAALMGLEGGHAIQDDLRVLDIYYRLGARYMTLTHTAPTNWADSSGKPARWNGLTQFGKDVVMRMNHLGMMVDISHVSDKTFWDTLAVSRAPLIASHSSCRALCNAPRNMTDEMIRALAKNDGVIQINFYSAFLDQPYRDAQKKVEKAQDADVLAAHQRAAKLGRRLTYVDENEIRRKYEPELPTPSFERIADHIDHAVKVGGVDHVGLGSDFDGVDSIPRGMEDASKLPSLVKELARRGYSEDDLIKILGGNLLRVMRQVEEVSRQMQTEK